MTRDLERDTCSPKSYQRGTGQGFLEADKELPPHMGGSEELGLSGIP